MNTTKNCCKYTCSNNFPKFEPQQFAPYYDNDPNSVIKRKVQPQLREKMLIQSNYNSPKIVLKYEKYDLRNL